jgi:hypothetical protein
MSKEHWRKNNNRGKPNYSGKLFESALSTTNPTLTGPGLNPRFRDKGSANNLHSTAQSPIVYSYGKVKVRVEGGVEI